MTDPGRTDSSNREAVASQHPATGPRTAFIRFSRPLTTAGISVNTFVFLITMFGYMLFSHACSLKAIAVGVGVLIVVMASMGIVVPLAAKRASARFYKILERESGGNLTPEDLRVVRDTLLLIPWRAAVASALGWLLIVPSLTWFAFRLTGEHVSWIELELVSLVITPFTFVATLLAQDQVLSPFVKFYFPAAGVEAYNSRLSLTEAKRTLLFNITFAIYPLVLLVLLGINAINSSRTIAEASRRFSEIASYAVGFLVCFLSYLVMWRYRKAPARELGANQTGARGDRQEVATEQPLTVQENLVGTVLDGKYLLEDVLGKGGMATVYRGKHLLMARPVAVKILSQAYCQDLESIKRFRQEAKTSVAVHHANIVEVYDCGVTASGILYLVMDYIEGTSLSQLCRASSLSARDILTIMQQVATALAHAHDNQVIHRDIKPGNIMITRGANQDILAKVVDFGIAKIKPAENEAATRLTQTGQVFGSPAYMSPEQCQGKDLDSRSDIYSLGCVFYELLTGAPPFASEGFVSLAFQHMHDQPARMQLTERCRSELSGSAQIEIERIVARCLQKDPSDRYQKLSEFLQDLSICLLQPE